MNIFRRIKNLYQLSGIEVDDNSVFSKSNAMQKITEIFKNPNVPTPPKKLATIIRMNPPEDETDPAAE